MCITFLHFAIFTYQFKLGPCIVNRPCIVKQYQAVLEVVLFMSDIIFIKTIVLRVIFFCTTVLFLAPLYITLYKWRGPIAIAIVEVMPRSRVMYSNMNKHSSSTLP